MREQGIDVKAKEKKKQQENGTSVVMIYVLVFGIQFSSIAWHLACIYLGG